MSNFSGEGPISRVNGMMVANRFIVRRRNVRQEIAWYLNQHAPEVVSDWLLRCGTEERYLLVYEHVDSVAEVWRQHERLTWARIPRSAHIDTICSTEFGGHFASEVLSRWARAGQDVLRTTIGPEDVEL